MELIINSAENRIEAYEGTEIVGKLEYTIAEQTLTIEHTFAYKEGCGVGKKLVLKAIELAQDNKLKISSHCSFAQVIIDRQ